MNPRKRLDEETVDEVEEEAEEETQEETEEVADESKDAGPRYTEHVLERVMKTYRITDREGFLAHASTFDKDGNSFLKELELLKLQRLGNQHRIPLKRKRKKRLKKKSKKRRKRK